jgi:hypothetical protein
VADALLPLHPAMASASRISAAYLMYPPLRITGTTELYGQEAALAFRLGDVMVTLPLAFLTQTDRNDRVIARK